MFNKSKIALLGASALTMISFSAPLAQAGLDGNPFEGLYLGFNANYSKVTTSATFDVIDANTSTFDGISGTDNSNGKGFVLYGGIGSNVWGPLYMGIEAGLGVNGGTGRVTDGTNSFGLKAGFSFDITGRIGTNISDNILIYGLGGYTSIKFSSKGFNNGSSKALTGFRLGGGFEIGIMEDIALRVEYSRTEHSGITLIEAGDRFRFDPSTQVLRIGLVLHMD